MNFTIYADPAVCIKLADQQEVSKDIVCFYVTFREVEEGYTWEKKSPIDLPFVNRLRLVLPQVSRVLFPSHRGPLQRRL